MLKEAIIYYITERNLLQGNPAQERKVAEFDELKVFGEDSIFINSFTSVKLKKETDIHLLLNCWEELYLISLRYCEKAGCFEELNEERVHRLKYFLKENFENLKFFELEEKLQSVCSMEEDV